MSSFLILTHTINRRVQSSTNTANVFLSRRHDFKKRLVMQMANLTIYSDKYKCSIRSVCNHIWVYLFFKWGGSAFNVCLVSHRSRYSLINLNLKWNWSMWSKYFLTCIMGIRWHIVAYEKRHSKDFCQSCLRKMQILQSFLRNFCHPVYK